MVGSAVASLLLGEGGGFSILLRCADPLQEAHLRVCCWCENKRNHQSSTGRPESDEDVEPPSEDAAGLGSWSG